MTYVTTHRLGRQVRDGDGCIICQSDYQAGDRCMHLACGHSFHAECIKPWIRRNRTCPLCRHPTHVTMSMHRAITVRNRFLVRMIGRLRRSTVRHTANQCMACDRPAVQAARALQLTRSLYPASCVDLINASCVGHLPLCECCFRSLVDGAAIFIQTAARRMVHQQQRVTRR